MARGSQSHVGLLQPLLQPQPMPGHVWEMPTPENMGRKVARVKTQPTSRWTSPPSPNGTQPARDALPLAAAAIANPLGESKASPRQFITLWEAPKS